VERKLFSKYRVRYTQFDRRQVVFMMRYVCYDDCGKETSRKPLGESTFGRKKTEMIVADVWEVDKYIGDTREYNKNYDIDAGVIIE